MVAIRSEKESVRNIHVRLHSCRQNGAVLTYQSINVYGEHISAYFILRERLCSRWHGEKVAVSDTR